MRFTIQLLAIVAMALCAISGSKADLQRGLAWGVNDNLGPKIAKGLVKWYWHWQDGPNSKFDGKLEWVPCFWGPKYQSKWAERKKEMKNDLPKYILGVNEPEIPGQSNLTPKHAAKLHMQELEPYAKKGVKISSPQMVYKTEWLQEFMDECDKLGCTIDFIALHWYGTTKDMKAFKKWVTTIHKKFNKPIWITEYGITSASGSSQAQIKKFHMDATCWMNKIGYVQRAAWLGCFEISSPPDSYASAKNAFLNSNGSLRDIAYWYMYTHHPDKRSLKTHSNRALPSAHIARRTVKHLDEDGNEIIDDEDPAEPVTDIVDCDDICQARNKAVAAFEAEFGEITDVDDE
ncbi:glycoside hydrolase [Testicularia cyperi]|uniref:Glycoside hydrolase n=1 Tax=Testicularia cyperi TaxID=1882483 RepID=A0A317XTN6_9BASI|nr:glycoside hydrolase [Testicularia cyperi]